MTPEPTAYCRWQGDKLQCLLCPQHCSLSEGRTGLCQVRQNQNGRLRLLSYGQVSALALDPIEKKPLYHFYPGAAILSVGSYGCNLACPFCQNHHLAHEHPATRYIEPEQLADITQNSQEQGSIGLAFTYNEPLIWYEYVLATAILLKERGLKTVLVTNGYLESSPLEALLPYIDAMNIDVKAFNDGFYRRLCRGRLETVKATVEKAVAKVHVEITTLLIPGENDAAAEIKDLSSWLAQLNPEIPLHLSRYHPAYRFDHPPTSPEALSQARDIACENLRFVYLGNLWLEENPTLCLTCGHTLITRQSYQVKIVGLSKGKCLNCGNDVKYITSSG